MLEGFLQRLCHDLECEEVPKKAESGAYSFSLSPEITIKMQEIEEGLLLFSEIGNCPLQRKEAFFMYAMKANFLGQGTGNCIIGMDENEKFLTLSLVLTYDMNYKLFKDALEDFANYLDYWKEELIRHNTTT